jgi:hypothetical protein
MGRGGASCCVWAKGGAPLAHLIGGVHLGPFVRGLRSFGVSFMLTCPHCETAYTVGATLTNVTVVGSGQNIVAPCPKCGLSWDITGGGNGTWSTFGGRLVKVASFLSGADSVDLLELRARLAKLEKDRDDQLAAKALVDVGVEPPSGGWLRDRESRMEIYTLVSLLLAAVSVILMLRQGADDGSGLSPSDVQRILQQMSEGGNHRTD